MIFSELYSAYYNAVAAIISKVIDGEHSEKELQRIVYKHAFAESSLTVLPSLKNEKWQILHSDFTTPIENKPTMPLTTLQKQWLKAISLDPRVKLFDVDFPELSDVEPLFTEEDYFIYDKYGDGDPYGDEEYIKKFRVILKAITEKSEIKIEMDNRNGKTVYARCKPLRLEYSEKDDKFRVATAGCHFIKTVNLSRIKKCVPYSGENTTEGEERESLQSELVLRILDERNALERVMLHFAHFEKQAEKLDEEHYLVKIKYAADDEPEMVIRILSFGPLVEVLGAESIKNAIIEKLKEQKICGLF